MDIGNLHVIDYYLHRALIAIRFAKASSLARYARPVLCRVKADFDIETEQREGWAYD